MTRPTPDPLSAPPRCSPLTLAHSEWLARASPAIYDMLIAFVGGAARMIGRSRKEKSTVITRVAIATALMPPICTAGYGLATGQAQFFLKISFAAFLQADSCKRSARVR